MQGSPKAAEIAQVESWPPPIGVWLRKTMASITRAIRETDRATLIKKTVVSVLPDALLQPVRRMYYARLLKSISAEQEPDLKLARHLARPGSSVIDIGANVGVYTKFTSRFVGNEGRVYSIEPIPVTCDVLRSNVRKLGLGNVEVINAAVSDTNGTVTMEVPCYSSGVENFYEAHIVSGDGHEGLRHETVDCRTLDALFSGGSAEISLIKCDVEGHELKVIEGAAGIIESARPAWLIEIQGDPDDPESHAHATFSLMREFGYEAYWFDGSEIRPRRAGERSTNYFFLTQKHLKMLQAAGVPGAEHLATEAPGKLQRAIFKADEDSTPVEMVA